MLTITEATQLYEFAKSCSKLPGEFAEVGVYRGGSALVIALAKRNKKLYLFDTFTGIPKVSKFDKSFEEGEYVADLLTVKKNFKKVRNISFHSGIFPDSAKNLKEINFSFVHLDVDIYSSTIDSLKYFYPRLTPGGVLISHDYPFSSGVERAFDEFFRDKPEVVMKSSGNQGFIVKLG